MRGHQVKRGVTSTLERVFQASGQRINKLQVYWTGKTAGINFTRTSKNEIEAMVVFPAIDDLGDISRPVFNNMIGFAIHELGHAWFTDNEPWDLARSREGEYLSSLINGLEDVRIEQAVIDSGYAENSAVLFEELTNSMLDKYGYVEPDDISNVAFMLAIEGRRLNGYNIPTPTILDRSPYAGNIRWAVELTLQATSTKQVVAIAQELLNRLKQTHKAQPKPKQGGNQKQKAGDKAGDQGDQGQQGDQGDQQGKGNRASSQGGEAQGEGQGDQPSDKPKAGKGKSTSPFAPENFEARRVEPDGFIVTQLKSVLTETDKYREPAVRKARIHEISFH
jgi:hypothetical protein